MCQGTTLAGNPCKANDEPYCRHHRVTVASATVTPLTHPKAIRKFKQGPSKTDGPGHIYVYYIDRDTPDTYYKIGRTAKGVKKRLGQWKQSILKKAYYVKNQKLAETLIHLELDKIRVYRYTLENGSYYTVWKSGKELESPPPEKLVGIRKNIEWFKTDWKSIKDVISVIINLVNDTPSK